MLTTAICTISIAAVLVIIAPICLLRKKVVVTVLMVTTAISLFWASCVTTHTLGQIEAAGKIAGPSALEKGQVYKIIGRFEAVSGRPAGFVLYCKEQNLAVWETEPIPSNVVFLRRDGDRLVPVTADHPLPVLTTRPATSSEKLPSIPDPESDGN